VAGADLLKIRPSLASMVDDGESAANLIACLPSPGYTHWLI
jgi:hypothetical protein